ncbi:choline sulfate utilization transcriptional regulator [Pseudoduganella albidiflava]|uniref:LysR family transcriptional regulator n=1 Tax=Pseudoduganella albidiflava TaxID=321983 RepID=A0A411X4C6_9BURK|nr:LysR substrate-binding domain-containing protein [Pseudoduganella albidiflava]QBI03861.1 LysR family transcriptional regulator [Pseudoduganella albidiflava]GGY22840.1 LysR family transcriptional regulator [Pseudoduganella albidiflava]
MGNDVPMQSLLLFACAVRHLNFTQVAEEFGTTQPAVSQRIAALEKYLGTALFKRAHRGVVLTAEGAALYDAVHDHLAAVQGAVERLRTRRRREVLTVATDFAFANFWLMPRLAAFQEAKPALDVRIVTSQNGFDIRGEPVDLAISFGAGQWPGCDAQPILPEVVVPVCSAGLLARHAPASAGDVMEMPLLHLESSGPVRWMTWHDWARAQGASAENQRQSLTLGNYPLVIQAAVAGRGVALGWRPLVDDLLRGGQLVRLPVPEMATPRGYYLVRPHGRASGPALDSLRAWIAAECAA